jgi:hypothetical protein
MSKINLNIPDFKKQQGRVEPIKKKDMPDIQSIDPVIVENSYKLLSHVKKDISLNMDKVRGRNEEQGGIYP